MISTAGACRCRIGPAAAAGLLRVVADTHRRAVVLGATVNVVQAHRMVQVGGGGGGGGGAGGAQ